MKFNNIRLRLTQFLIAVIFFCCCAFNNGTIDSSKEKNNTAISNDTVKVRKSVISFLRWYKTNLYKANSFPLLAKDSKGYYMVNKKACSDYLNFLKTSKLVSDKYIGYWKTYFDDKAITLKKDKIKSDIPDGFDFDFILITQEPDLILKKIDSMQFNVVSMNKNVALVGLSLPSDNSVAYEFEMYKTKEGWQVGYISTPNYD